MLFRSDADLEQVPYYRPPEDSTEMRYLKQRRESLGGHMPRRKSDFDALEVPPLSTLDTILKGTGDREISTTMAFVRILSALIKDKQIGERIVPIVPDEARTFGMEGMFRQFGIYAHSGRLYEPVDSELVTYYKEAQDGQILEEGITEAGSMSSFNAAGTAYSKQIGRAHV